MDTELKNNLEMLIETMNGIEVSGKTNLTRLLASIQYLEKLKNGELGNFVRESESESEQ